MCSARYFGIDEKSSSKLRENIQFLYYKDYYNFAVKLITKEKEDVILYKCSDVENTQLDQLYNNLEELSKEYDRNNPMKDGDIFTVPYINLDCLINYNELCNKEIKNLSNEYISEALQNFNFALTKDGGKITSEIAIQTNSMSCPPTSTQYYEFNSPFVIFIREEGKSEPYFAVKILDGTFLETK